MLSVELYTTQSLPIYARHCLRLGVDNFGATDMARIGKYKARMDSTGTVERTALGMLSFKPFVGITPKNFLSDRLLLLVVKISLLPVEGS